jgi:hypothetical protein
MALEVTVYATINETDPTTYEGVDYLSLVSSETYGPPALVAPAKGAAGGPKAKVLDRVLYLNTQFVPMFEVVRVSD